MKARDKAMLKMLEGKKPQAPTIAELQEIAQCCFRNRGLMFPDFSLEQVRSAVEEECIVKFPRYIQGCPGYVGELFVVVWNGGPANMTVLTRDANGKMRVEANGELGTHIQIRGD